LEESVTQAETSDTVPRIDSLNSLIDSLNSLHKLGALIQMVSLPWRTAEHGT
jgi:hypothetical protein